MTRCSLVVTTHERPDALERVLDAVAAQSRPPDELIVADDGSGPATAAVVARHATAVAYPVHHAWQPHEGFRAGRIRNVAIARARCEYVVLLDGDMVAHRDFLGDHLALARRGHYSQGVRIQLDSAATQRLLAGGRPPHGPLAPGLGILRRAYALRSPALACALRGIANAIVAIKACNQGFWRDDLLAVNGFDEAMTGWGAEDKELCARLANAGIRRQTLICAAIAWHLEHPPAPRNHAATNRARWQATVRARRTRCEAGIDGHPAA
ncbi:MAG: glycosyltransferase family 2 protein [Steroidobacteraceae bacterium]|nr:glycosyltransferase family 2 protein [Steroidobacteraceae bacterium]